MTTRVRTSHPVFQRLAPDDTSRSKLAPCARVWGKLQITGADWCREHPARGASVCSTPGDPEGGGVFRRLTERDNKEKRVRNRRP